MQQELLIAGPKCVLFRQPLNAPNLQLNVLEESHMKRGKANKSTKTELLLT